MGLPGRTLLAISLLGTALAVPAFAQTSGAAGSPGAALSTYAACAGKPSQADTDAAHGAYMAGKGSFDEADYTTAINYFKDAYRRDCTKHELLIIIARAYELQGNRREAVHALETYLDRVPTAADADVQRRHIANLKREISDAPPASVAPSVSAAASASASAAPSASSAPSAVPSAAPSSAPATEPPASAGSHSVAPWIVVGVGGAALIVGGVLYAIGAGDVSSAENVCGSNHTACPSGSSGQSAISQGNSGRSDETIGVIAGGVGLAAVAGGLLWHFLEPVGAPAQTGKSFVTRPFITPEVAPGYAGVGAVGRF